MQPKISVVMSVYNGEKYLQEAVGSILEQTFRSFEFIIVDDGSTDRTWAILQSYDDPRIVLLRNEENIGLTRSLNEGLAVAQGEYIARMDSDDISLPERLEKQAAYLDSHPNVGLVGAWVEIIDECGKRVSSPHRPVDSLQVRWSLFLENCIAHSTTMYRRSLVEQLGGYSSTRYSQDYDLWSRMSFEADIVQLPEVLVKWRGHSSSISVRYFAQQREVKAQIAQRAVSRILGRSLPLKEVLDMQNLWSVSVVPMNPSRIDRSVSNLEELLTVFCRQYQKVDPDDETVPILLRCLKAKVLGRIHTNVAFLSCRAGDRSTTWKHLARAVSSRPACLADRRLILTFAEAILGRTLISMIKDRLRILRGISA